MISVFSTVWGMLTRPVEGLSNAVIGLPRQVVQMKLFSTKIVLYALLAVVGLAINAAFIATIDAAFETHSLWMKAAVKWGYVLFIVALLAVVFFHMAGLTLVDPDTAMAADSNKKVDTIELGLGYSLNGDDGGVFSKPRWGEGPNGCTIQVASGQSVGETTPLIQRDGKHSLLPPTQPAFESPFVQPVRSPPINGSTAAPRIPYTM